MSNSFVVNKILLAKGMCCINNVFIHINMQIFFISLSVLLPSKIHTRYIHIKPED